MGWAPRMAFGNHKELTLTQVMIEGCTTSVGSTEQWLLPSTPDSMPVLNFCLLSSGTVAASRCCLPESLLDSLGQPYVVLSILLFLFFFLFV